MNMSDEAVHVEAIGRKSDWCSVRYVGVRQVFDVWDRCMVVDDTLCGKLGELNGKEAQLGVGLAEYL